MHWYYNIILYSYYIVTIRDIVRFESFVGFKYTFFFIFRKFGDYNARRTSTRAKNYTEY